MPLLLAALVTLLPSLSLADTAVPLYKPSSRAPQAVDITTNAYGFSRTAPDALRIGDKPANFILPRAGGGNVSLKDKLTSGPVVLIFYRGHW